MKKILYNIFQLIGSVSIVVALVFIILLLSSTIIAALSPYLGTFVAGGIAFFVCLIVSVELILAIFKGLGVID